MKLFPPAIRTVGTTLLSLEPTGNTMKSTQRHSEPPDSSLWVVALMLPVIVVPGDKQLTSPAPSTEATGGFELAQFKSAGFRGKVCVPLQPVSVSQGSSWPVAPTGSMLPAGTSARLTWDGEQQHLWQLMLLAMPLVRLMRLSRPTSGGPSCHPHRICPDAKSGGSFCPRTS